MDEDTRRLFGVLAAVVVLVAAVAVWWQVREARLPRLVEVRVVVLGEGEEVASDVPRIFAAAQRVQVGAVLAFQRGDGPVRWISPFSQVESRGEPLAVESPERWPAAGGYLRAHWYTVEPSLFGWDGVTGEDAASRLEYQDFLDTDMGRELSAPVLWRSNNAGFLSAPPAGHLIAGGTLRFRVRLGSYQDPRDLFPRDSVASPGAERVLEGVVPAATRALDLPAGIHPEVSRAFRLGSFVFAPGVWPDGGANWSLPLAPGELVRRFLITTPRSLAALAAAGDPVSEPWDAPVPVSLRGSTWQVAAANRPLRWAGDLAAGDTLQVGSRFLILVADDGDGELSLADTVLAAWTEPPRLQPLGLAVAPGDSTGLLLRVASRKERLSN